MQKEIDEFDGEHDDGEDVLMDKHIHQMQKEKKDDLYTRLTSAPLGKVREEEESKEEMLVPPHTPFLPASMGGNPIVAADQFTTDNDQGNGPWLKLEDIQKMEKHALDRQQTAIKRHLQSSHGYGYYTKEIF